RRLSVEELAGVPYVDYIWGGIDLSPDGSEVAFSWNRSGTFEIFSAPLEGERIFQLTEANERSVWPRWSPDAKQIAFLRDRGGDERGPPRCRIVRRRDDASRHSRRKGWGVNGPTLVT